MTKSLVFGFFISLILLSSCVITKTQVGTFREETGEEYTYSKARQIFLFWGILRLGTASAATPSDGSCEVITKRTFVDALITGLTVGIVSSYTIKIKDKRKTE